MSGGLCRACSKRGGCVSLSARAGPGAAPQFGRLLRLVAGLRLGQLRQLRQLGPQPQLLCSSCARLLRRVLRLRNAARRTHRRLLAQLPIETRQPLSPVFPASPASPASPSPATLEPSPRPRLRCNVCGVSARNRSALIIHSRTHSGERPYKCPYCDKCFTQGGTLTEHIKRMHSESQNEHKTFSCDVCGKLFMRRNGLNMHLRTHTNEKPYQCSYCARRFSQKGTLNQHTMVHTGERPFSCDICQKTFIAGTTLRRHMTVHSDEKKFKCTLCEKALKSKFALKKHMIYVHTSEKPIGCLECSARFSTTGNLYSHMKKIHSAASGRCDICDRQFSNLADHTRVHTGERPFECDLCRKCFAQKRGLTAHINKHLNSEKYKCTFEGCSEAFSMSYKLKYHTMKSHGDSARLICQFCSKGYYRMSDMTKHLKSCSAKMEKFS